ncbi:MBL fold metallo-hydrolase [Aureitalea sp. L0-47]|uniref:MBL fold metallo-hydrolase n=1 Tax=Aureitalea sp. L0-47 TaxID=2816962 RepID=UPI002237481B|nr:MBL fold metallo-hydrolase [Aureitalea sp. L0-47]MCW5519551.1 MBL fold metallo-hydrolase [Aureitalea sp. L0-47]
MKFLYVLLFAAVLTSCKSEKEQPAIAESEPIADNEMVVQQEEKFEITPISHATMVLNWDGTIIYVDPVGGAEAFAGKPSPDLILITDIHGDHLNLETLQAVSTDKTKMMVPQAVADKLPAEFDAQVDVLNNGDTKERYGFAVEAIPMYNLREEALKFHIKGRGNGYVIEKDEKRVYISGDTEDIPEMRALKDIDVAFVCMNLPYTMTELAAAKAVVDFKPKNVYPYHYRGSEGFSDVNKFKGWIMKSSASKDIKVVQLDWYPNKE